MRVRAQHATEALRLLLPGAEMAGDLDGDRRTRQVNTLVCDTRDDEHARPILAKSGIEPVALGNRRFSRDQRRA